MLEHLSKLFVLFLAVLGLLFSGSAILAAPAVQEEATLVETVTGDERFSTLATALEEAGLVETLQGEGPFTVFAPTNEAFEALPDGMLDDLLADPEALTDVLLYHVVDGLVMSGDALRMSAVPTMEGASLNVNLVDEEQITVSGANMVEADIPAANGVIHAIDIVLLPPEEVEPEVDTAEMSDTLVAACVEDYIVQADDWLSKLADRYYNDVLFYTAIFEATNVASEQDSTYAPIANPDVIEIGQTVCIPSQRDAQAIMAGVTTLDDEAAPEEESAPAEEEATATEAEPLTAPQNILETVTADDRFATLVQAIQTANLADRFEGEGPVTLFAPTDEAFADLPAGMLDDLLADEAALQEVLLYHVIDGMAMATDIIKMDAAPTLQGESATVIFNPETEILMVDNATVIQEDIEAANGFIHVVDTVLLPPGDADITAEE